MLATGWTPSDVQTTLTVLATNVVIIIRLFTDKNGNKLEVLAQRVDGLEKQVSKFLNGGTS